MADRRESATDWPGGVSGPPGSEEVASPLAQFEAAVLVVNSLPRGASGNAAAAIQGFKPSTELMLRFYALYKQATSGPCRCPRPPFWDLVGKVKWDAWRALGDMPSDRAMLEYSRQLRRVIESLPAASPEVSGLIDKLGSFYRLVESTEPDSGDCGSEDIKRGLVLANRIRWHSGGGGGDGSGELDVNSNFLTQSLPPPMTEKAAAAAAAVAAAAASAPLNGVSYGYRFDHGGGDDFNGPGSRSHPDLRQLPTPTDWAAPAAAVGAVNGHGGEEAAGENSDENDEFCDSYDNFLLPESGANNGENVDDNEDDEELNGVYDPQPAADVTGGGGGGQPNAVRGGGSGRGRHHGGGLLGRPQPQQQAIAPLQPPPLPGPATGNGRWIGNGGGGGSGGGGFFNDPASPAGSAERQLLLELRHMRAALDRLAGDLVRVHDRLDRLERRPPTSPSAAHRIGLWLSSLLSGGGDGGGCDGSGLSLRTLLLMLAWPVVLQLLWRLPWCAMARRLMRLRATRRLMRR